MKLRGLFGSCALVAAATGGCIDSLDIESDQHAVINADLDTGHPAVGMIQTFWDDGAGGACTGTLIGPRTVLTAGHCVSHDGAAIVESAFYPAFDVSPDLNDKHVAFEVAVHPNFDMPTAFDADNDVALLHLVNPLDDLIEPMTVSFDTPVAGTDLSIVGHGCNTELEAPSDFKKRVGPSQIREVLPLHIALEHRDPSLATVCHGDSGGPALMLRGGQEVIVGVHSQYEADSTGVWAESARMDIAASFISEQLANPPIAPTPAITGISFEMRQYPALIIEFDPGAGVPTDIEYDVGELSFRDPPDRYSAPEWESDRRAVMALPGGTPEGVQSVAIVARTSFGTETTYEGELDLTRPSDEPMPEPDEMDGDGGGCSVGGSGSAAWWLLGLLGLLFSVRRARG